jgi:hypothetical protein
VIAKKLFQVSEVFQVRVSPVLPRATETDKTMRLGCRIAQDDSITENQRDVVGWRGELSVVDLSGLWRGFLLTCGWADGQHGGMAGG